MEHFLFLVLCCYPVMWATLWVINWYLPAEHRITAENLRDPVVGEINRWLFVGALIAPWSFLFLIFMFVIGAKCRWAVIRITSALSVLLPKGGRS